MFASMSDDEIVAFLEQHIHEITDDPHDDFPESIYLGLRRKLLRTVKDEQGFAIIAERMPFAFPAPLDAQLVFLYTAPSSRGAGVAGRLIEDVKKNYLGGGGLTLSCCGNGRRRFFEKHGFVVAGGDERLYEMYYNAISLQ